MVSLWEIKCSLPILLKLPREFVEALHYANPLNRVLSFYKPINLPLSRPFLSFGRCNYCIVFFFMSTTSSYFFVCLLHPLKGGNRFLFSFFFLSLVNLYKNLVSPNKKTKIKFYWFSFLKKKTFRSLILMIWTTHISVQASHKWQ
jgi:hypothetical protein